MMSRRAPVVAAQSRATANTSLPRLTALLALGGGICIVVLALMMGQDVSVSAQQTTPAPGVSPEVAKRFPEGSGKATFLRICSKCHSPMNTLAVGQTREEWEGTITKMAGLGAQGTDEDFTAIADYLERNFPPRQTIEVNKATASQLQRFLQLDPETAKAIVSYRDKHGDFKSVEDVKHVPGVSAATLDSKRALLTFN